MRKKFNIQKKKDLNKISIGTAQFGTFYGIANKIGKLSFSEGKKIVEEAQKRSYRIVDEAEMASSARREGADRYARETLFDLEERLAGLLGQVRKGIDALGIESETVVQNGNGASLTS